MAVARLDTATSNGSAKTHTFTVSAGTDRALIVGFHVEQGGMSDPDATAVDYGGQAMTKLGHIQLNAAVDIEVSLWYLNDAGIAAASGTTITVTASGTTNAAVHAASYTDVDQTTPLAQAVSTDSAGSSPNPLTNYPLTGSADNAIIALSATGSGAATATWANVTEQTDICGSGSCSSMADTLLGVGATIDPECTWGLQIRAVAMAAELAAAGGAPATGSPPSLTLMGAGS